MKQTKESARTEKYRSAWSKESGG